MAEIAALRERARGVRQTLKITAAMYLISQAKSKKAREKLDEVSPFFATINDTMADVIRHSTLVKHSFFGKPTRNAEGKREVGLVVITGDKGLAGAYNHNVVDLAVKTAAEYDNAHIFVVGEMGRHLFPQKGLSIEEDFDYSATDPTLSRAWDMSRTLISNFRENRLREVLLIYTHLVSPLVVEPRLVPLLPLDPTNPFWVGRGQNSDNRLVYSPNIDAVISRLVPVFLVGALYGAMVESFCSENSSRMNAMKSASDNAKDMLADLTLKYNRLRQEAITAQITEVAGGFEALK